MQCTLFQQHQRYLHLVDNRTADVAAHGRTSDKLFKVRPLLDYFVKSFHEHYRPERELRIDEIMMGHQVSTQLPTVYEGKTSEVVTEGVGFV